MKIYLIRHGQTLPGEEGRYQGFLDESLSKKGRADLLKAPQNPPCVYISPAKRARETAAILFPGAVQIPIPGLMEMNFGAFEGRRWQEMKTDPDYRAWVDGLCLGKCPGGESRADFSDRVCRAFADILRREQGLDIFRSTGNVNAADIQRRKQDLDSDLFIVAHGGTQMAILERWGRPARDYYDWQSPCGCGWLLTTEAQPLSPAGPGPREDVPWLFVSQKVAFVRQSSWATPAGQSGTCSN